jgi:hypothetical protein
MICLLNFGYFVLYEPVQVRLPKTLGESLHFGATTGGRTDRSNAGPRTEIAGAYKTTAAPFARDWSTTDEDPISSILTGCLFNLRTIAENILTMLAEDDPRNPEKREQKFAFP